METILKDAFNPGAYQNFIPTDVLTQNRKTVNTVLIILGLIILTYVIVHYMEKLEDEKKTK